MMDIQVKPESFSPDAGDMAKAAIPKPPSKMTTKEKKIWNYVTNALYENGLCHTTDGLALMVVVRTFIEWIEATEALQEFARNNKKNPGTYITRTPNGYEQPHQLYYVTRDKKKELLQWLPECALTIPSFVKTKRMAEKDSRQIDLFADSIIEYRSERPADPVSVH